MYNLLERETDLEKIFVPVRVNLKLKTCLSYSKLVSLMDGFYTTLNLTLT